MMNLVWWCLVLIAFPNLGHGQGFVMKNAPPVFDFKRNWRIPENEPVGSKVAKVTAKDEGDTRLVFDIEPATSVASLDGSGYFRINPDNGDVILAHSLKGLAGNDFYLHVAAYDGIYKTKIEVHIRILKANTYTGPRLVIPLTTKPGKPYSLPPPSKLTTPKQRRPPFRTSPRSYIGSNSTSTGHLTQNPNLYATVKSVVPSNPNKNLSKNDNPVLTREPPQQVDGNVVIQRERLLLIVIIPITIIGLAVIVLSVYTIHKRVKDKQGLNLETIEAKNKFDWMSGGLGKSLKSRKNLLRAISNRYESDNSVEVPLGDKWEISEDNLEVGNLLGTGNFGEVYMGQLKNIPEQTHPQPVAVKMLKPNATENERRDLLSEMKVMKYLDPHPNIVQLYAAMTITEPICLIMEYVKLGKLESYLRDSRAERSYGNLHGESSTLTSRDLTRFAYHVARGMEYLSSKGIIHRDLAARNILVSEDKTCKVADFGFARDVIASRVYERKSEGKLPIRWMAPESLYQNLFTAKSDVWAFGILMWEIVTLGSIPYPGMDAKQVMCKVNGGYRLEKPEHCKREVYNIMSYCWLQNSNDRPTFTEVVQKLEPLITSEDDYIKLENFPDHSYCNITPDISNEISIERL